MDLQLSWKKENPMDTHLVQKGNPMDPRPTLKKGHPMASQPTGKRAPHGLPQPTWQK